MSWKILSPCVTREGDGTSRASPQHRKPGLQLSRPSSTPKLCQVANAMPNTPQACHVSKQSFGTETADANEALRLHNPIAPSSFQDIAQRCKTRQRSRKTGRWGETSRLHGPHQQHLGGSPQCGDPVGGRSLAELEIGLESSSAWPDVHQHRRKPINIKPRAPPDRTHLQLLITAHRQQDQFTIECRMISTTAVCTSREPMQPATSMLGPGRGAAAALHASGVVNCTLVLLVSKSWAISVCVVCICVQWRRRVSMRSRAPSWARLGVIGEARQGRRPGSR